ncbi:MAG: hypothetical protein H6626_14335 [Pseudobdellovibrionaceae bacterium]|nr:MAG: hypothetical protein H6626_14335 [Pseudobdellovibrionaceae bacterium]
MKKIVLIQFIVAMAGASFAHAQFYVGGGVQGGINGCPYPYGSGAGAESKNDKIADAERDIKEKEKAISDAKLVKLRAESELKRHELNISTVLKTKAEGGADVFSAVKYHIDDQKTLDMYGVCGKVQQGKDIRTAYCVPAELLAGAESRTGSSYVSFDELARRDEEDLRKTYESLSRSGGASSLKDCKTTRVANQDKIEIVDEQPWERFCGDDRRHAGMWDFNSFIGDFGLVEPGICSKDSFIKPRYHVGQSKSDSAQNARDKCATSITGYIEVKAKIKEADSIIKDSEGELTNLKSILELEKKIWKEEQKQALREGRQPDPGVTEAGVCTTGNCPGYRKVDTWDRILNVGMAALGGYLSYQGVKYVTDANTSLGWQTNPYLAVGIGYPFLAAGLYGAFGGGIGAGGFACGGYPAGPYGGMAGMYGNFGGGFGFPPAWGAGYPGGPFMPGMGPWGMAGPYGGMGMGYPGMGGMGFGMAGGYPAAGGMGFGMAGGYPAAGGMGFGMAGGYPAMVGYPAAGGMGFGMAGGYPAMAYPAAGGMGFGMAGGYPAAGGMGFGMAGGYPAAGGMGFGMAGGYPAMGYPAAAGGMGYVGGYPAMGGAGSIQMQQQLMQQQMAAQQYYLQQQQRYFAEQQQRSVLVGRLQQELVKIQQQIQQISMGGGGYGGYSGGGYLGGGVNFGYGGSGGYGGGGYYDPRNTDQQPTR